MNGYRLPLCYQNGLRILSKSQIITISSLDRKMNINSPKKVICLVIDSEGNNVTSSGESVEYISTKDVCNMLNINRVTLWRYGSKKMSGTPFYLLPAIKAKGRNLYKILDVLRVQQVLGLCNIDKQ